VLQHRALLLQLLLLQGLQHIPVVPQRCIACITVHPQGHSCCWLAAVSAGAHMHMLLLLVRPWVLLLLLLLLLWLGVPRVHTKLQEVQGSQQDADTHGAGLARPVEGCDDIAHHLCCCQAGQGQQARQDTGKASGQEGL
jgi:hypothetical protein